MPKVNITGITNSHQIDRVIIGLVMINVMNGQRSSLLGLGLATKLATMLVTVSNQPFKPTCKFRSIGKERNTTGPCGVIRTAQIPQTISSKNIGIPRIWTFLNTDLLVFRRGINTAVLSQSSRGSLNNLLLGQHHPSARARTKFLPFVVRLLTRFKSGRYTSRIMSVGVSRWQQFLIEWWDQSAASAATRNLRQVFDCRIFPLTVLM